MRNVVSMGVLAWALAGCGGTGEVYSLPVSKVESRLRAMNLTDELGLGSSAGSAISLDSGYGKGVARRVSDRGATLGWLEADIEAVDLDHTRVAVEFRAADGAGPDRRGHQKLIASVGRIALGEAIDAELEGRAFNKGRVKTQIAAYALTHRDEIASWDLDESTISDTMREPHVSSAVARNPELGVAMREAEARRAMKAASEPSLKLDQDRYN